MKAALPLVFLVAGEASSDLVGQRLMRGLERRLGPLAFAGVGGPRMAEAGLETLFPLSELSLVGVAEVLPHIPRLLRHMYETVKAVERLAPILVVFIDASGFARGVAKRLGRLPEPPPVVQYKAPQTWAYWPWRARAMARHFDLVLAILPFEPAHLARYGVEAAYIGHPALESNAGKGDGTAFRARYRLTATQPLLCVLPGSRASEVRRALPVFGAAVRRLAQVVPDLVVVVPTVRQVAGPVGEAVRDWQPRPLLLADGDERYDAFAAATAALTMTGTATVELALAGVPMVTGYKLAWSTALLARLFLRVRYVAMVNLLLGRAAVPELLQHRFTAGRLAAACLPLLTDAAARERQKSDLAAVTRLLATPGGEPPSERAVSLMAALLETRPVSSSSLRSTPSLKEAKG